MRSAKKHSPPPPLEYFQPVAAVAIPDPMQPRVPLGGARKRANLGKPTRANFPHTCFDLIAVAASAGGLAACRALLEHLPAGFPAALVIVQHLERTRESVMAKILARSTRLEVKTAEHMERVRPGVAYVARPDYHILVNARGRLLYTQTALVHFLRPAADPLFQSVAVVYGPRAIAVVLTGNGSDGSLGAVAIKQHGGLVIAQDEATAQFTGMPLSVVQTGQVDAVLPLGMIAPTLLALVHDGVLP